MTRGLKEHPFWVMIGLWVGINLHFRDGFYMFLYFWDLNLHPKRTNILGDGWCIFLASHTKKETSSPSLTVTSFLMPEAWRCLWIRSSSASISLAWLALKAMMASQKHSEKPDFKCKCPSGEIDEEHLGKSPENDPVGINKKHFECKPQTGVGFLWISQTQWESITNSRGKQQKNTNPIVGHIPSRCTQHWNQVESSIANRQRYVNNVFKWRKMKKSNGEKMRKNEQPTGC